MLYLVVKTAHILSALLFLGAGLMTAWYKVRADRARDPKVIAWYAREIVLADWIFTLPSGVTLPATGVWLASLLGQPLTQGWVALGLACYALAGTLWVPAARLQIRMRQMAEAAARDGTPLPDAFHRANRVWLALGVPAFAVSLFAVWLMVAKHAALSLAL